MQRSILRAPDMQCHQISAINLASHDRPSFEFGTSSSVSNRLTEAHLDQIV